MAPFVGRSGVGLVRTTGKRVCGLDIAEAFRSWPAIDDRHRSCHSLADGLAGVYRKAHLAGEEKHYFAPGSSTPIFSTPIGVIGICICYDTFFPELARSYALKGAHWLICPFNTGGYYDHVDTIEHLAAARAIENKLFVAMCNRVGSEEDVEFSGRSAVADPFGTLLVKLGEDEDLAVVEIDGTLLRKERAFHPVFADRRPDLYSSLVEPCETNGEVA